MTAKLYDRVVLRSAIPKTRLRPGDVATLVDFVDHPNAGERGAVLEVFNALGESIDVVTVPVSSIEALRADEMPCVRPLAEAK